MPVKHPQYPVNLIIAGKPCLVVGGGAVAAHKIEGLLACEAHVDVIATRVSDAVRAKNVRRLEERPYRPGDVAGYRLVISATNDSAVNRQVYIDGESSGVLVN